MSKKDLIIKNATVITMEKPNRILQDHSIIIKDGIIEDIVPGAKAGDMKIDPDCPVIDAKGKLAMPGMICSHTHFYGAFSRGMPLKGKPPSNFVEILEGLWWKLDKVLLKEEVKYSALICLIDAIKHGTTTLIDHHASPQFVKGSLDEIHGAALETGLRTCLCYEVTDRNSPEEALEGIRENVRFIEKTWKERKKGDLTRAAFGLHASFTLSDETLMKCAAEGKRLDTGFHIHVAEDQADNDDAQKRSGKSAVERLYDAQILGPKTLAIHCVNVNNMDLRLLMTSGSRVVHNPQSNMNNAVGIAPLIKMDNFKIPVSLGTDGFSQDMFREMKFAYVLHKIDQKDPRVMGADRILEMQYENNAKTASLFWDEPLGVIAKGAAGDIILLDYRNPTEMTPDNFPWHHQFGLDATNVNTTIVAGKVLMKDRVLQGIDEAAIMSKARELAEETWKRV